MKAAILSRHMSSFFDTQAVGGILQSDTEVGYSFPLNTTNATSIVERREHNFIHQLNGERTKSGPVLGVCLFGDSTSEWYNKGTGGKIRQRTTRLNYRNLVDYLEVSYSAAITLMDVILI